MKNMHLVALALATLSGSAMAADHGLFYVAGGRSARGPNYSIGLGTNVDVLEINSINLGTVNANDSAKFVGLSLVQNAAPINNFNWLFRVGFGKTTTTFADGSSATRVGFRNGVIFGVGGQYQLNSHLAVRAELNRMTYATSADGMHKIIYPATFSALFSF